MKPGQPCRGSSLQGEAQERIVILSNKQRSRTLSGALFGMMFGAMIGGLVIGAEPVKAQVAAQPPPPLAEVTDVPHLDKLIKAAQGKVVLVNFWATWHEVSAAQYPAFLYLYNRYHGQGLEVISVATDPQNTREERVIPFIQSYRTPFPTYLRADGDANAFLKSVDTSWTGTLPRTYLIGRDGRVRQVYNTRINAVPFEETIRRLLKEEAPKPKPAPKDGKPETPPRNPKGILGGS